MSPEENERLVRVGPGTAAGALFRRYWQPALLSSELPENDGAPVRVRLLGEDLVAFRATDGRVGLVDAYCPHRRAPMFFGRNEECGLRCVYHGWKFDADGTCVDMPTEAANSPMRQRVGIKAYPTLEAGGAVWAYMGPPDEMPPPPDYEWLRAPATHRHLSKTYEHCNYLQALEGGLDTAHSSFAHNNAIGDKTVLRRDGAPQIEIETTDYGYYYVSTRRVNEDSRYVRIYHYVMPNQQMRGHVTATSGGRAAVPKLDGHIWVPIDDEQTFVYNWSCGYDQSVPLSADYVEKWDTHAGRGPDDLVPGTFKLKRNPSNDYLIDRQIQKTRTFTGIQGVNTQDFALQEGMGPIVDRSQEHLGASDRAIVMMRRLLREAMDEVVAGKPPKGLDPSSYRDVRPHDNVIRADESWQEKLAPELVAKW